MFLLFFKIFVEILDEMLIKCELYTGRIFIQSANINWVLFMGLALFKVKKHMR